MTPVRHPSPEAMRRTMAESFAATLDAAMSARGRAVFCLGGGRFPAPLLREMAALGLDWRRLLLVLGDERFVPLDHDDSNEGGLRRALGPEIEDQVTIVGLRGGAMTPDGAALEAQARLEEAGLPPFDLVLLGLGPDGHTASLFPDADPARLARGLTAPGRERVVAMRPGAAPHDRLTLTAPTLLETGRLALYVSSRDNNPVFARALEDGPVETLPVRAFLRQSKVPLEIHALEDEG